VERAITTLEGKYGGSLRAIGRDQFIHEQVNASREKLFQLNALSHDTLGNLQIDETIDLTFFHQRIDFSKQLFETRYPENRAVEVSTVNTAAEAVAMALAQAQAQSLAESVAVQISTSLTENLDRLPPLGLRMTKQPNFSTPKDWFANPVGVPIDDFERLKSQIHPHLRQKIFLSPHMQHSNIVSHFGLIPTNHSDPHLFISQEEANTWVGLPADQKNTNYQLIDLREDSQLGVDHSPLLRNMKGAVLKKTDNITVPINTDELRQTELTNVTGTQLVPTLHVDENFGQMLTHFSLTSFGISRTGGKIPFF
jgi:hypothetical protein